MSVFSVNFGVFARHSSEPISGITHYSIKLPCSIYAVHINHTYSVANYPGIEQ